MPTLPLYESTAHPDAWHRVTAPGGYEWWRFEAIDDTHGLHVAVNFFDGDPRNPAYALAYRRFRRRPTRVTPPVPSDFPHVESEPVGGGNSLGAVHCFEGFRGGATDRLDIAMPPHSVRSAEDGSIQLGIGRFAWDPNGSGKPVLTPRGMCAELVFEWPGTPQPALRELVSAGPHVHFGVDSERTFDVTGDWFGAGVKTAPGSTPVSAIPFKGRGWVDHVFGTGPMPEVVARWMTERRTRRGTAG